MNRTSQLANNAYFSKYINTTGDIELAIKYFENIYADIKYIAEEDAFEYRGLKFDYFKSGIGLYDTSICSFLLVNQDNPTNWLFTYGGEWEREKRWQEYIDRLPKPKERFSFRKLIKNICQKF